MFRELCLKEKVKSFFTKNAIHVMIKLHKNLSSLPFLGSYFIIFEKIYNNPKNIWFKFFLINFSILIRKR
jgi:hypothetical protein